MKHALRSLTRTPGFTCAAILILALGIGANTAIFSLVHDLFLRGLPFSQPDQIVRIYGEAPERNLRQLPFGIPRFEHYRDSDAARTLFADIAADAFAAFAFTDRDGAPVRLLGARVTANYFTLLGLQPLQGRLFHRDEETSAHVALLTTHAWRTHFGSDPAILGRSITLNGTPHTVVGIIPNPPAAWFGPNAEVFTTQPFNQPGVLPELAARGVSFLRVIARIRPGVTLGQVHAALATVQDAYRAARPDTADASWQPTVVTAADDTVGNLRPAFATLLCAVGCVLLIACSNVANLLLVRFAARRREIAVRLALGAPRGRLIRLFVSESVLVSLLAGAVGLLLAAWLLSLVPTLAPNNALLARDISLHPLVLVASLALALLAGLAIGLYPALQSSRADLITALRDHTRALSGSRSQHQFRRILLGSQVALSFVLVVGAALLITSFLRLQRQEPGFRFDRLWFAVVNLPSNKYPDTASRARFAEKLQAGLENVPGLDSVALGQGFPLTGADSRAPFARADAPVPMSERPIGLLRSISPGYLKTFGIPLLAGRDIDERDGPDRPHVVLISRAAARRLFPHEDPLGRRLLFGSDNGIGQPCEIVGVVNDVRSTSLAQENEVEFYRPLAQRSFPFLQLAVRTTHTDAATATPLVRAALRAIDPDLPFSPPTTMDDVVAASLGQRRLLMTLLAAFAALALLLSLVGIYSLVAYTVAQRTSEIGIRLALGASPAEVHRLILAQGMRPVLVGLLVGLIATVLLTHLLTSQLYQISPRDPLLLGANALLLALVAAIACWIPARRATQISPLTALRTE